MRKWTAKDYRTMPWKNGGGSTTELAIFPEQADIDSFVWRLSTATVAQDGPFSYFAQIDRSLAILSGQAMVLKASKEASDGQRLTQDSLPYRFPGEEPIYASLEAGTIVDLNLMTRRDACQHFMQRLSGGDHQVRAEDAQQILLFCEKGNARVGKQAELERGDLLLLEEEHEGQGISLHIQTSENSILYLMRISFLNHLDHHGARHVLG